MNIIARLEYELTYYDSVVHRFNHYTTRTPSQCNVKLWNITWKTYCGVAFCKVCFEKILWIKVSALLFACYCTIIQNCWSNYHILFVFLHVINKLVWTYPLFCKFSENNLPTLQGLKRYLPAKRLICRERINK